MAFVVPKDGEKVLTVKGLLNSVGVGGGTSGTDLAVTLCNGDNASTSGICGVDSGTFEVRGTSAGSSTLDTMGNSGDIAGNAKIARRTKPTVTLATLPTDTLTNGDVVAMRFTVAADAGQKVSLKKMTFELGLNAITVNSTSSTGSGVHKIGDSDNIAGSYIMSGTCTGTGTCTMAVSFTSEQVIPAGGSNTYELIVPVTAAAAGDSLSTKLLSDSAQVTGELETFGLSAPNALGIDDLDGTDNTAAYNFLWSDNSANPHNDTTSSGATTDDAGSNDWTNGRFVKTLPTSQQTLTF
jgi:hypothetical protein